MTWWRAIWAALQAFFAALQGKEDPQDIQDHIVQEAQNEIEQIHEKTDDELLDIAIDSGLVRRDADPGSGAGGAGDLANPDFSGRGPGTSFKAGG